MSESSPIASPDREVEVFPPTLREVMLRPRWIGLLLLCLVVAGVFAWLGQWQLSRAINTDPLPPGATEQIEPLDAVVEPGKYLPEPFVGQRVEVAGTWVPGDFLPVAGRFNDGVEGFWVTGQLRVDPSTGSGTEGASSGTAEGAEGDAPTSIAVAIGWAATADEAAGAIEALEAEASEAPVDVVGRIISDEGPALPPRGADPFTMTRMSTAALLARWHDAEALAVYRPYLVSEDAGGGLEAITARPPEDAAGVNWLNIFYAAEWAVFAGFAFYLWYRLAKDAWEREVEDLEDAEA